MFKRGERGFAKIAMVHLLFHSFKLLLPVTIQRVHDWQVLVAVQIPSRTSASLAMPVGLIRY